MSQYNKTVIRFGGNHDALEQMLKKVVSSEKYILEVNKRNNDDIMDVQFAVIPKKVGHIDFNILIPQPTNVFQGNLNKESREYFGVENCWDKWRMEHWGCEKNAHQDEVNWLDNNTVQLTFWTNYEVPKKWLEALAKYAFSLRITDIDGEFANEDFGSEMGYIKFNEDYPEEKEILTYAGCDYDVECYDTVWGEGMAATTGYFDEDDN